MTEDKKLDEVKQELDKAVEAHRHDDKEHEDSVVALMQEEQGLW